MDVNDKILDYLAKSKRATAKEIIEAVGKSRAYLYKRLDKLVEEGKIIKQRGKYGLAVKVSSGVEESARVEEPKGEEPPLVHVEVSNPITYLKHWWKRVIGNEGMNVRFSLRVRPLTAIAMILTIGALGFGIGRLSFLSATPVARYIPIPAATPTPDLWRETAFSGMLRFSEGGKRYYLVTSSSEAISLELPRNLALSAFVGKRIFATGRYNIQSNVLVVSEATDLEILPTKAVVIPTLTVTPTGFENATPQSSI